MRPLYAYYKNLKIAIENKNIRQTTTDIVTAKTSSKQNGNENNINPKIQKHNSGLNTNEGESKSSKLKSNSTSTINDKKVLMNNYTKNQNEKNDTNSKKTEQIVERHDTNGPNLNDKNTNLTQSVVMYINSFKGRKLTRNDLARLDREIEAIKVEQLELRQRLQIYQSEFQKVNNRRVRYHKDIEPVEYEYNKYRENKQIILELEQIIANERINNTDNKN